jgi:hypothetical protein
LTARCRTTQVVLAAALLLSAHPAAARLRHRVPAFEPTDLDLEDPLTLELGLQFGAMFRDGEPSTRLFVPDFELDLGLTERVELDVDGALSLDEEGRKLTLAGDNLWTSTKLGFISKKDPLDHNRVWALGAQLGPRLPTAPHAVGTGFGAVLLAARMAAPWHVIVNFGSVLEPRDRTVAERSLALLGGIDLDYDLDAANRWSLLAEVGSAYSLGPDPHDVHTTLGVDCSATDWLDLSLVGFYGFLAGGDRYGVFLGITPKFSQSSAQADN